MFEWWWKAQRARDHARSNMHARVLWPVTSSSCQWKGSGGGTKQGVLCMWLAILKLSLRRSLCLCALCTDYRPMQKYLCVWLIEIQNWHKMLLFSLLFLLLLLLCVILAHCIFINIWISSASFVYWAFCCCFSFLFLALIVFVFLQDISLPAFGMRDCDLCASSEWEWKCLWLGTNTRKVAQVCDEATKCAFLT